MSENVWRWILFGVLWLNFSKHFFGLHWNWETCDCCKRKWRDIRADRKARKG